MEQSTFRIGLKFQNSTNDEYTAVTSTSNNLLTTAIVVTTNNISQPVNGSLCQIASLEVYRGRRQITEISHDGFFLSDEGIFTINQNNQAYNIDEYEGELYRLNISCIAEGLPKSGCLFFKVIGKTEVKNAKFNLTVQGIIGNNISDSTTLSTMTSQVTDPSTTNSVKITTADFVTDVPSLTNGTDRPDLIITATGPILITTAKTNQINDRGFQVGSLQFYMVVAAGSCIAVIALTAIVILVIYVTFHVRSKSFKFSLTVSHRIPRQRQSRHSNIPAEEAPSADVSILPDVDHTLRLEENHAPLESPVHSSPSANAEDHACEILNRDRSLPPRKCDKIPIYIFLGPNESDPPFPKSSIECEQNLAYLHLGPEDSSTAVPLQYKPITCKQNAAYIHLDPEDTST